MLSIFLPLWPVERVARRVQRQVGDGSARERREQAAVLVVSTVASRQLVEHACARSLHAGVLQHMTLAHARALLGNVERLYIAPHEPDEDRRQLGVLARWSERWSPVVSVDPPDGLIIDLTGVEHLFGGEEAMAARVEHALRRLGLTASLGIASTVGAAWAVARHGHHRRMHVKPGHEREALVHLPVAALRIQPSAITALDEVGIRTIGEALALPRSSLPARYGSEMVMRLDQATGHLHEPVFRLPEKIDFTACIELPGGTTAWESTHAATHDALRRLTDLLESRGQGLRELTAYYDRIDRGRSVVQVRVSRASRAVQHLWNLIRPRLERVQLGEGVERITLAAGGMAPVKERQFECLGAAANRADRADDAAFSQMLDVIANRIGRDRVVIPVVRESHRPERMVTMAPITVARQDRPIADLPRHRPSHLIEPPEPVRVMALWPDGPVARVRRQGVDLSVRYCSALERIGGEWWRSPEHARDYCRVQDEHGRWLWVFREARSGEWFIHGEWA
ncbi:MAG: DNA polymerase Y family protein [Phycisphaeraceae bacterium]|nr:DNA polymerase Y family protein [Phycisphaerae bacterium]MBX3391099.1 DNA polymerase Y family protein [Phycisphaeraceae bacterium]